MSWKSWVGATRAAEAPAAETRGMRARGATVAVAVTVAALAGCASAGTDEHGVYRSPKGYTVSVPAPAWTPVTGGRADLELRQEAVGAGMAVNASCDPGTAGRPLDVLTRHLLFGLRDWVVEERDTAPLDGGQASHAVLEARVPAGDRMRVEVYVLKDTRCVFDFLYTAPPDRFAELRPDFEKLVRSFSRR
jgi:hypothetical protein